MQHRLRRACRNPAATQDRTNARLQLARVKGFGEIIVRACLTPCDPLLRFGGGCQHQDRCRTALRAQRFGKIEAVLPGHHHIQHQKIEGQRPHTGASLCRRCCSGDDVPLPTQIARQQCAQPRIVIDDQKMRQVGQRGRRGFGHGYPETRGPLARRGLCVALDFSGLVRDSGLAFGNRSLGRRGRSASSITPSKTLWNILTPSTPARA